MGETRGKRPISYVVADEAHCVSEWGHDFRTPYLNLSRIITRFGGTAGMRPPIVALTGTASESVLRDIQREIDVHGDEAIIRTESFERKELKYEIVPVGRDGKPEAMLKLIEETIPSRLGVPPEMLASSACGGIVFCPHVNGRLGVLHTANLIGHRLPDFESTDQGRVAYYSGEPPDKSGETSESFKKTKAEVQRSFKSGAAPILVATSAFGMGIDKPNVRYTVHYVMGKSVEAFAQEAGRAGRDKKAAICAILFTDDVDTSPTATRRPDLRGASAPAPGDCLDEEISVEEAAKRANASPYAGDDAAVQMYLHTLSYQGVSPESLAVRTVFDRWMSPHMNGDDAAGGTVRQVTIADVTYKGYLRSILRPVTDTGRPEPADPDPYQARRTSKDEPQQSVPELQRLLYRLSSLGIVTDYTILYKPGGDVYSVSVERLRADEIEANLYRFVERYRTSDRVRRVKERHAESPMSDPYEKCLDTLCWFVYEEIEQRRRQGIRNMRQMIRECWDGERHDGSLFAEKLNGMLSNSSLTRVVFDALAADDPDAWAKVSNEITAAESANHVYLQSLRALEDAPGHPGLTLLLALALQGAATDRTPEIVDHFRTGLQRVRAGVTPENQTKVMTWAITELARLGPTAAPKVLTEVMRFDQGPDFAAVVLRGIDANILQLNEALVRMGRRCLLQSIDTRLQQFMRG